METPTGGDSDVERNIWLIAHGALLARERLLETPVPQTALVPMIYEHLGIPPRPEWTPEPPKPPLTSEPTK